MAEEKQNPDAAAAAATPAKGNLKSILVVLAVLLLEGGTIGVTMYLAGGPSKVQGVELQADLEAEKNKPVELLLVKDRFPNLQTGRHFLYDTEVYIVVRKADNENDAVKATLENMKATTSMEVGNIIRSAHPSYFEERTLATLRRQIKAMLDERLTDKEGKSLVQDVLITRCTPFRADY